jgi:haloalkane dehalogenase
MSQNPSDGAPEFALRTPEERFQNLVNWPYEPSYTILASGLRVHHVDVGNATDPVVLCMHGEPTWAYLYRKMIPLLVANGFRVIAPDLPGFGRSDKPKDRNWYTYNGIVDCMVEWFDTLSLPAGIDLTLMCQDWGGLIGLRVLTARPDVFSRAVVANTGLPTGDRKPTEAFLAWQKFSQETPVFPIGDLMGRAIASLSPEEVSAYEAPFPDDSYKAGARILPSLVPTRPDDPTATANRAAWAVLAEWDRPFLTAFSDGDPITAGGERIFQRDVKGAQGQAHVTIEGGGHFLQDDKGDVLAKVISDFAKRR